MEVEVTILSSTIYVTTSENEVVVTENDPISNQQNIEWFDEGGSLGSGANEVNFVGAVVASRSGNRITVTVTGGSAGSGDVVGPSSAVNNNIAVFDGITGKLIKDGSSTIAAITAAIPSLTNINSSMLFVSAIAGQAITNQPVAETYFISTTRHVFLFDATKYTAARLIANVTTASASANSPRLYAKWKTSFAPGSDLIGDFTTLGTGSGAEACSLAAVAVVASNWITLPAGAKADVFWALAEIGGDAAADPAVSHVVLQFRV